MVQQDLWDQMETKELEVYLVMMVIKGFQDQRELKVQEDCLELTVYKDNQE